MSHPPISSAGMLNREEVKRRRIELDLSYRAAAVRAGWTWEQGSRWQRLEKGIPEDPSLSTVEAVAMALRCSVADLLTPAPPAAAEERNVTR